MENLDTLLEYAENNMHFISMLEITLNKLECEIQRELHKYIMLFRTPIIEPLYEINAQEKKINFIIGEIKYSVDIIKVRKRICMSAVCSSVSIEEIEKALMDELKENVKNHIF